ncbi:uncharacterized protein LOC120773527 [Bactrocera tryoni]|uniref:uncharacterized protein LOC120773527 n=1 Tax=Bactrocera tryoni TaxID=59916 RepID=UPI001A98EF8D|nr:uncharacterized protein LOC120773527 [Bactrocera tryoni]
MNSKSTNDCINTNTLFFFKFTHTVTLYLGSKELRNNLFKFEKAYQLAKSRASNEDNTLPARNDQEVAVKPTTKWQKQTWLEYDKTRTKVLRYRKIIYRLTANKKEHWPFEERALKVGILYNNT